MDSTHGQDSQEGTSSPTGGLGWRRVKATSLFYRLAQDSSAVEPVERWGG